VGITEDLVRRVRTLSGGLRVSRVVVGAYLTYAELSDGSVGLAYTERSWGGGCCPRLRLGSSVVGSYARDVAELMITGEGAEVSLGLAVVNAVLNSRVRNALPVDALELLRPSSNDVVGMVGLFEGYVRELLGRVREVRVLEIRDVWVPEVRVFPVWRAREFCEGLSKLVITSSTLSNRSLDYILSSCGGVEFKVLVGPSTPMDPEVFRGYGIKALCGSLIKGRSKCFELICEGAGVRDLMRFGVLRKVCLINS